MRALLPVATAMATVLPVAAAMATVHAQIPHDPVDCKK